MVEFGGAQLKDLHGRLNGGNDVARRAAWRTNVAGRPFRAADQAQPQAANLQRSRDARREAGTLAGFIEDVKTSTVKDKVEWAIGYRRGEKVQCGEATAQISLADFGSCLFDRKRRDIDSEYVEAALGHPNCIRSRSCTDLERPPRRDAARADELDEQRLGLAGIPGQFARGVTFIPLSMRHDSRV